MKDIIKYIIIIIPIIIIGGYLFSIPHNPAKEIIYVPVKDTITDKQNVTRIIELEHKLKLTRDSLIIAKDSLGEDLFVAKYKLNRIKYYNDIAAKGNNIKYLRGWINRVLNE